MPAVSKAQQRFMGMVHAVKKGEMAAPSPEVAKVASTIEKKDAKDFASTKHKKLPDKIQVKESGDYWHPDPKKDAQISGLGNKQRAREDRPGSPKPATKKADPKKVRKGESYYDYAKRQKGSVTPKSKPKPKERKRDKIARKLGNLVDRIGGIKKEEFVKEAFRSSLLSDRKYMKKVSDEEKRNKEKDKRMKFGKFYDKAKDSAERLRPGEVKRWDPKLKKYVSNKD